MRLEIKESRGITMGALRKIRITAGSVSVTATLGNNATADAIWDALPLQANGNRWGDEIYFGIPVRLELERNETAQDVVQVGDLAYWPPGHAFCIFWGPTPASVGSEIRPASTVNVFGSIDGDAAVFAAVRSGTQVQVEKIRE
jgi:hypothetical protein